MQREEKQLESSLESLILRVTELKGSVGALIWKLEHEHETISWPSLLDNYALMSGQLSFLGRLLKSDKMPQLKNLTVRPVMLSPDPDEHLEKLTEGRVVVFNHEVAPNYLRTKAEPEVEERTQQLATKAQKITPELVQKQITTLNKCTSNCIDIINHTKDHWENDSSQKSSQPQTHSTADTETLVSSVLYGKNLRTSHTMMSESPGTMKPQQQQPKMQPQMTKAASNVKVTIKSGASNHPYQRP